MSKLLYLLSVACLLVCVATSTTSYYITYNNAEMWQSRATLLKQQAEMTTINLRRVLLEKEVNLAMVKYMQTMRKIMDIADSEKIRAEKSEFELDRVRDAAQKYRFEKEQLVQYVKYLRSKGSFATTVMSFDDFANQKPTPALIK